MDRATLVIIVELIAKRDLVDHEGRRFLRWNEPLG